MNTPDIKSKISDSIASLEHVYQLKSMARSGWLQSGIAAEDVESIASHSFGMSILILYLSSGLKEAGIDVSRALSMALIHDVAESIVGDITPDDAVLSSEKFAAESEAFDVIMDRVVDGKYFRELWDEFEANKSREARLVKRIDKLDMLFQAYLYEKKFSLRLDSFWENMDDLFRGSESESLYTYIRLNRYEVEG